MAIVASSIIFGLFEAYSCNDNLKVPYTHRINPYYCLFTNTVCRVDVNLAHAHMHHTDHVVGRADSVLYRRPRGYERTLPTILRRFRVLSVFLLLHGRFQRINRLFRFETVGIIRRFFDLRWGDDQVMVIWAQGFDFSGEVEGDAASSTAAPTEPRSQ